jgi:hypothetical protein
LKHAIAAVADLLTRPGNEEKSAEELAAEIIEGMLRAYRAQAREALPVLKVGGVYRFPWISSTLHVVYRTPSGQLWLTNSTSNYGLLISEKAQALTLRVASRATRGGSAESPTGYAVGDWLSIKGAARQRYKVVATTETCALLEGPKGCFMAEPNDSLLKYFVRRT